MSDVKMWDLGDGIFVIKTKNDEYKRISKVEFRRFKEQGVKAHHSMTNQETVDSSGTDAFPDEEKLVLDSDGLICTPEQRIHNEKVIKLHALITEINEEDKDSKYYLELITKMR